MLEFEYCECGCHGFESDTTGFWIETNEKKWQGLSKGHGWMSPKIGVFDSFEKAAEHATELAKPMLVEMEEKINELRRQINSKPVKQRSFEQEVREQFAGKDNAGIRKLLRAANNSRQIRLLANSVSFTEMGKAKLEAIAQAFDRTKI